MNSPMREIGTEMSCLMLPPSNFWASEMDSRMRQRSSRWASLEATTASSMTPSSRALPRTVSKAWRNGSSGRGLVSSTRA